jgi:hypothetical protein
MDVYIYIYIYMYMCVCVCVCVCVCILKSVVCILLRVLGHVQDFRLTQHWFEYFIQ